MMSGNTILYHNFHVGESSVINRKSSVCLNPLKKKRRTMEFLVETCKDFPVIYTQSAASTS